MLLSRFCARPAHVPIPAKIGTKIQAQVRTTALLAVSSALLAGCSSSPPKPAYKAETFSSHSPFELSTAQSPRESCAFAQRALLSQGYQLTSTSEENTRGSKFFQPRAESQLKLEIALVCLPTAQGTTVYASAVQTRYELKTSANNTGLSVAGIGSISLPWSAEKEALVKVAEETVIDPDFYKRLFELITQVARNTPLPPTAVAANTPSAPAPAKAATAPSVAPLAETAPVIGEAAPALIAPVSPLTASHEAAAPKP